MKVFCDLAGSPKITWLVKALDIGLNCADLILPLGFVSELIIINACHVVYEKQETKTADVHIKICKNTLCSIWPCKNDTIDLLMF